MGRVMRGDHSFLTTKGNALGYCVLESLQEITSRIVLFRNSTSKYYHQANLSVLTNPVEL